ncbi:MAG: LacI family DNA-binding transcriptional regulator [Bacteroidota bacterium]
MHKQPTLKDIATELGVSTSTVSRALHDHYSIGKATREKVKKLAKQWGFKPNPAALSLLNNRTKSIGIIIPEIIQPFYALSISGMEAEATKRGYHLLVCQSLESYQKELQALNALINSRVDGIVVCYSTETTDFSHITSLHEQTVPLVLFDRIIEGLDTYQVISDDFHGAYLLTKNLLLSGYKRIAHITGPKQMSVSRNRLNGYVEAHKKAGIFPPDNYIKVSTLEKASTRKVTEQLLVLPKKPDAIFAINDPAAMEVIQVLKANNIRIPEEIAVAGFDNQQVTEYLSPTLTTVKQQAESMGKEAIKMIVSQIEGSKTTKVRSFETKLIVRESSYRQT